MKKAVLLSMILLATGFSKDLFKLGLEAYDQGEFDKAAIQWQKDCDGGAIESCTNLGTLFESGLGVEQTIIKRLTYTKKLVTIKILLAVII